MMHLKKMFSLFLLFVLLVSVFPSAFAAEETKYTSDTLQISVINGKTQITVSQLDSSFAGKTVLCGWYQEGRLTDIRLGSYNGSEMVLTSSCQEYDTIQYMVWDTISNLKPLASQTIDAKNWIDRTAVMVTCSLEDYLSCSFGTGMKLGFYNEEGNPQSYLIPKDAELFYNGNLIEEMPENLFGNSGDSETRYMIVPDGDLSGFVTMMDADGKNGYETVEIEVGIPAIVNQNTGTYISFLNAPVITSWYSTTTIKNKNLSYLNPDSTPCTVTKAGVTYDFAKLKSKDVLLLKPDMYGAEYQIEVLGKANCISGWVEAISSNYKRVMLSDGAWYGLYPKGYCVNGLQPQDSGNFYIYQNQVIAVLSEEGNTTSSSSYGYILAAALEEDDYGNLILLTQLLTEENEIHQIKLDNSVTLYNLNEINAGLAAELADIGGSFMNEIKLYPEDLTLSQMSALCDALCNRLIGYTLTNGDISQLYFEQTSDEEESMYLTRSGSAAYDAEDMRMGSVFCDEKTTVFFISGQEPMSYGNADCYGDIEACGIGTVADLTDGATYTFVAFDDDNDAYTCKALVIMNVAAKTPAEEVLPEAPVIMPTSNRYGFITNAVVEEDTWGNASLVVQLLDESNAVYEASFADAVPLENVNSLNAELATALGCDANGAVTLNVAATSIEKLSSLAKAMINRFVTYSANDKGQISAVTFEQSMDEEEAMYLAKSGAGSYDEKNMILAGIKLDENTRVFYISDRLNGGTIAYGSSQRIADIAYCRVADGTDLTEATYTYLAFDTADGTANAVVILNTMGEISPASHVAVIQNVALAKKNGAFVNLVEYYIDGELKTAYTAPDLNEFTNAVKGDVYQIRLINGEIAMANELADYSRTIGQGAINGASVSSAVSFGAIQRISNNGSLRLSDGTTISANDAQTANVYVLDPNRKDELQLYVGSLSDAYVDTTITEAEAGRKFVVDYLQSTTVDKTLVAGQDSLDELLDYAFAYNYDGDAMDIVIYKAYSFEYEIE